PRSGAPGAAARPRPGPPVHAGRAECAPSPARLKPGSPPCVRTARTRALTERGAGSLESLAPVFLPGLREPVLALALLPLAVLPGPRTPEVPAHVRVLIHGVPAGASRSRAPRDPAGHRAA